MKGMQWCQIPLAMTAVRPRSEPLYLLDLVPLLGNLFLISYLIIGRFFLSFSFARLFCYFIMTICDNPTLYILCMFLSLLT
jgi:hypothetical protein